MNDAGYAVSQSDPNKWDVTLRFDVDGGKKFAQLTKSLAGTRQPLGIFLDDQVVSEATVGEQFKQNGITGGAAVITGNFDLEEAQRLSNQLKGGSLPPVPVSVEEIRTVGASLGQDSISPQCLCWRGRPDSGVGVYGVLVSSPWGDCGCSTLCVWVADLCLLCLVWGDPDLTWDCRIYSQYWHGSGC